MEKKDIFTLHLIETTDEMNDLYDASLTSEYDSEADAQKAATELAIGLNKSYPDKCFCISVMAGEYRTENGNVYGNPEAIWTISSLSKEETIKKRKEAYFSNPEVDAYAVMVKNWDVIKQTLNPHTKEVSFEVDGTFETRDDAMTHVRKAFISIMEKKGSPNNTTETDWYIHATYRNSWGYCWVVINTSTESEKWHKYMKESVFYL